MSDLNASTARKPSGLKPPSKIARPTNILLEKTTDRGTGDDLSSSSTVRKSNDTNSSYADDGENFIVGDRVWVGGTKPGVIAFIGETQFGPGDWAGVVLDEAIGKNDGAVAGVRYFQCAANKGIFARPSRLTRFPTSSGNKDYCNTSSVAHYSTPVTPDRNRTLSSVSFSSSIASSRLRTPLSQTASGNGEVKVGDRVIVKSSHGSKAGMLRYFGTTEFGSGLWCGVELDEPLGKNDGSVAGVKYFDCAPQFGLFVPAGKVSRSPISKKSGPPCVIHPDGITRQGTRESLRSTSTVQTSATSNLRTNRKSPKTLGTSFTCAPRSPLQDQVKEKEAYIQQLLKERELERAQITTAATQAEEAEKKLTALQKEYEQIFAQREIQNTNLSQTIEKLEREKTNLRQQLEESRKKLEDLQFNLEEESITKSEIQALNEEYVEKLKNFERVVSSQHASLECDAHSSGIYTAEGSSEKGSSPGAQPPSLQADANELSEELLSGRRMIVVLTEKTADLENECQQLRESLDKLKLVDKSKDEMINTLRNELTSFQQTTIRADAIASPTTTSSHIVETLKSKLAETELENASLKTKIASTNEKLSALETSLRQRNTQLENDQRENETLLVKIKNDLQFEIDENKVRIEEATLRLDELTTQLAAKEKESAALAECIARLCDEIDQRNTVVNRVILDTEDVANNIAQAIDAAAILRRKEGLLLQIEDCDQQPKEKILSLLERVEQSNENSIVLLKKLETLAEVISRKDTLLEESADEKETLRREFQESIESKTNELKQLESKYADLEKVKIDVERQLKKSEESIKSMEQMVCGNEAELKKEATNLRYDLETKRVECDRLMRELVSLKDDLQSAESKSRAEHQAVENEIGVLRLQIESTTISLNAAIEEKEKLRNHFVELSKLNAIVMRTVGAEVEDLPENFVDYLNHIAVIEKNVRTHENQYAKLKEMVETLNASNSDWRQKVTVLEDECKRQREEKEILQRESQKLRSELTEALQKSEALGSEKSKALQRIATLEDDYKRLQEDKDVLKKERNELRMELEGVKITLHSQKTQYADTESETMAMKEKLIASALTEVRLKDLQNEHERIQTAFKQLEGTKTALQSELDLTNEQNAEISSKLEAVNLVKENLERKIDELSSGIRTIEGELTERDHEVAETRRTMEALEDSLTSTIVDMKSECQELYAKVARLENEVRARSEETADLVRKLDEQAASSNESAKETAEREHQTSERLKGLQDSLAALESAKNRTQSELEIANEENTRLKHLLDVSNEDRQKCTSNWTVLREKEVERERQLVDLIRSVETLQAEKNELEEKLKKACEENGRFKEESSAHEKERLRLLEKSQEFSSDSIMLNEKIAQKEHELAQLVDSRETLQRACSSFEVTVNKLEYDLEETRKENFRMRNELEVVGDEKSKLAKQADELIENSRSLNDEIVTRERKLDDLRKELSTIKVGSGKTVEDLAQLRQTNSILEEANASLSVELSTTREQLAKLTIMKKESELERRILEEKLSKLKDEERAREATHRLTTELNSKLQTLQRELESKERSYRTELAEVDENIRKLALEKDTLTEQLGLAKNEIIKLSCASTEEDNKKIPSDDLKNKNHNNNNEVSSSDPAYSEYSQLLEDKTTAENQVQFLNSVIVDMQRKNEKLLERVQYLENIIPPDLLKPKKVVAPRLFCDICDIFDLHDTDDCPVQCGSSSPIPIRRETNKVKPSPRPYCESCEVFGHTREDCNEEETF